MNWSVFLEHNREWWCFFVFGIVAGMMIGDWLRAR